MAVILHGYTQEQLDIQYSPSNSVDDFDAYIEAYTSQSAAARDSLAGILNLQYADAPACNLDLFLPETNKPPLIVFFHGGFWQVLSKDEFSYPAVPLNHADIGYCSVNYTLAQTASLREIVDECRRAIAWLYENAESYGYDKNRIFLAGHSAGAHLAAMLVATDWSKFGITEPFIKGTALISGVYELATIRQTYVNDVMALTDWEVEHLSPCNLPVRIDSPLEIIIGEDEADEFKRQSLEYYTHTDHPDRHSQFTQLENYNHFDIMLDFAVADTSIGKRIFKLVHGSG